MTTDPQVPQEETKPQAAAQTGPGWDSPGQSGTPSGAISAPDDQSLAGQVKSYWRRFMETSALEPLRGAVDQANEQGKQIIQDEIDHAHPIRAALAKLYFGIQKPVTDAVFGVTTPENVALAAATGGESTASQALKAAAGLYFGYRGSQQMMTGRQEGETATEEIQRRAMGAIQAVAGAGGAVTGTIGAKEALRSYLQNSQGVSGDLAGKIQAKIELAQEAQDAAAKSVQKVNAAAKAQLDSAKSIGDTVAANSEQQIPLALNKIKELGSQVVAQEQAGLSSRYNEIEQKATAPVTSVSDIKAEIVNSIKASGVQDGEISKIENKIFAALPKDTTSSVRAPTYSEQQASQLVSQLSKQGAKPPFIRSALANLGYVPTQIDTAMTIGMPGAETTAQPDVSYEMTRRIKNDLWGAQQSATDPVVRQGLGAALDNVNGIRQRYADAQGFGKQAAQLDADYMKFKRELGSGTMSDFLSAHEFADQNMYLRQAQQLINSDSGEALRGLFKLAGVDTSPLRQALETKEAFADLPSQVISDVQKNASAQVKQIAANTKESLTAIDGKPIVPGKSNFDLAGKGNVQLRKEALEAMANNAKQQGMTNPNGFTQVMYGTAQLATTGSPIGVLHIGRGLAPGMLKKLLGSEGFQDFVAQEAGVTPEAMPKFREAISKSAPYLQKLALSTAAAGGINASNPPQKQQPIVINNPRDPNVNISVGR